MIELTWTELKTLITSRNLKIQYFTRNEHYYIHCFDKPLHFTCKLYKDGNLDQIDFENNYASTANIKLNEEDTDGASIVRIKAAKKGWTFSAVPFEFQTSQIGSLYAKNLDGSNKTGISLKFYNEQGQEITDQGLLEINEGTIVRSVIDFEPNYDYEIIGGQLRIEQDISSAQDCRLWIIAAPDIPANMGGSKEMTSGVNLRFLAPQNTLEIDGRVSKFLMYDSNLHTNKLRFIFQHTAGLKIWIHTIVELYKA